VGHTAALPAYSWRGWYRDEEDLPSTVEMLAEAELSPDGPPGDEVRYSSTGYLLLQLAVEETTGRPFHRVAAEKLFSPLGLERSSFQEPLPRPLRESAVWGHYQGETIRGKGRMYPAAPAGLWTTPSDLARLMAEVLRVADGRSHDVVPVGIAREMLTPVLPGADRTLGWSVEGEGEERRILHAGRVAGFNAYVVGYPERGQGLAVMSNSHGSHSLNLEVARAVATEYGWPGFVVKREVVELGKEELRRFEGSFEYEVPAGVVVTFTVRGGKLFGRTGDNPEWEAVPIGDREFMAGSGSAVIRFQADEEGRVTGLLIGVPGGSWTEVDRVD
jgi:CubicO group peptidase (beta-lactamase class C family)